MEALFGLVLQAPALKAQQLIQGEDLQARPIPPVRLESMIIKVQIIVSRDVLVPFNGHVEL